jgi:hypothetical protein
MDKPPFSLAFVMVKESFAVPATLFYLANEANKNKHPDHLKPSLSFLKPYSKSTIQAGV